VIILVEYVVLQGISIFDVNRWRPWFGHGGGNALIALGADADGHSTAVSEPTFDFQSALTFDR